MEHRILQMDHSQQVVVVVVVVEHRIDFLHRDHLQEA
jgi:hypothetical protein